MVIFPLAPDQTMFIIRYVIMRSHAQSVRPVLVISDCIVSNAMVSRLAGGIELHCEYLRPLAQ